MTCRATIYVLLLTGVTLTGCVRTAELQEQVPVYETRPVRVGVRQDPVRERYTTTPELALQGAVLAILPFHDPADAGAGASVSAEMEHWFTSRIRELHHRLKCSGSSERPCVRVVSRTRLALVMAEQDLAESRLTDEASAIELRRLLNVTLVLTGHVRSTATGWRVIFKAIDTETSAVVWSAAVSSATLSGAVDQVTARLVPRTVERVVDHRETPIMEPRRVQVGTRTRLYTEEVTVPSTFTLGAEVLASLPNEAMITSVLLGRRWDHGDLEHRFTGAIGTALGGVTGEANVVGVQLAAFYGVRYRWDQLMVGLDVGAMGAVGEDTVEILQGGVTVGWSYGGFSLGATARYVLGARFGEGVLHRAHVGAQVMYGF